MRSLQSVGQQLHVRKWGRDARTGSEDEAGYLTPFIWVKTLMIKYFKTHFISPILGLHVL